MKTAALIADEVLYKVANYGQFAENQPVEEWQYPMYPPQQSMPSQQISINQADGEYNPVKLILGGTVAGAGLGGLGALGYLGHKVHKAGITVPWKPMLGIGAGIGGASALAAYLYKNKRKE